MSSHSKSSTKNDSSKTETFANDVTPFSGSIQAFESIDSLVIQYKKQLGVNTGNSEPSSDCKSTLEKRKLENDFILDLTSEDEEAPLPQDADIPPTDFTMGTGCFGRGIKSKMKERRRKQQLILQQFRPQWDTALLVAADALLAQEEQREDSRKRVRFDELSY